MSDPNVPEQPQQPQTPQPQAQAPSAPQPPAPPIPPAPPVTDQGYPAQAYPVQGAPAPQPPLNALALVSFIGSFFVSLVGIICGHIALRQVKRTGERGRGFALAGTIIGYVSLASTIIAIIAVIGLSVTAATLATSGSSSSSFSGGSSLSEEPSDSSEIAPESGTSTDERSPEFCAVLERFNSIEVDETALEPSPEVLALFTDLATINSPHQDVYARFVTALDDPTAFAGDDTLMNDYFEALTEDAMACSL